MFYSLDFSRGHKTVTVKIVDDGNWNHALGGNDLYVMATTVRLFLDELSPDLLFDGIVTIKNCVSRNGPVALYSKCSADRVIKLNTASLRWSQMVYQLSHELTHYFLRENAEEHGS